MPTNSKAVLATLNVYLADNNVKRNIGSFVANIQNANGDIKTINTLVLPNGGTYSYAGTAGNLITIAKCSAPLNIDVSFLTGGFTRTMTSILVLDIEVVSIVFTNPSLTDNVNLVIISG